MAVETSSFAAIRREKRPYVDKTRFLPTVLENGIYAQLIARPPRFGKTLPEVIFRKVCRSRITRRF